MRLTPDCAQILGDSLDHPESVCVGADGAVYAGSESGEVYRLTLDGSQQTLGTTGGFLLGIALDGNGQIHACDIGNQAVMRMDAEGHVTLLSQGTRDRPLQIPNHPVFDAEGNLYVSESGEYWDETGTGCIFVIRRDGTTEMFHAGPFRFANGVAIDPSGTWLYVAQSTAANIVRVPLDRANGPAETTHQFPEGTIPDGIVFAGDGQLVVGCYKPDAVFVALPDGSVEQLYDDPTGELLNRPTNIALHGGRLYVANLGGWHVTVIETDLAPGPIHRPTMS